MALNGLCVVPYKTNLMCTGPSLRYEILNLVTVQLVKHVIHYANHLDLAPINFSNVTFDPVKPLQFFT